MEIRALEGGCLCGATRFRVSGPVENLCCCHCRSCRLASGAPFVAWGTFQTASFQPLGAKLVEHASSPKVRRGFCGTCGTALTYLHEGRPGQLDVALAALDDPDALRPEFHLWVSQKLSWVSVADLPAYPEWRPKPS